MTAETLAPALHGPAVVCPSCQAVVCPSCQARLDGGPVVFWCPRGRHGVQAADLDVDYRPRVREVA